MSLPRAEGGPPQGEGAAADVSEPVPGVSKMRKRGGSIVPQGLFTGPAGRRPGGPREPSEEAEFAGQYRGGNVKRKVGRCEATLRECI